VFEDFARRTVDELMIALRKGADGIKKKNGLHGDLFLIRHILILREQLTPFEASLQTHQKKLDFGPTTKAITSFTSRSLLRFDASNGLIQFAVHGLPNINDALVDTKKEIDSILKLSCLGAINTHDSLFE
jgi:conserved oligomeric Golgi complex subunit 3